MIDFLYFYNFYSFCLVNFVRRCGTYETGSGAHLFQLLVSEGSKQFQINAHSNQQNNVLYTYLQYIVDHIMIITAFFYSFSKCTECETMTNPSYYSKLRFIVCDHWFVSRLIPVLRWQYIYTGHCILSHYELFATCSISKTALEQLLWMLHNTGSVPFRILSYHGTPPFRFCSDYLCMIHNLWEDYMHVQTMCSSRLSFFITPLHN